MLWTYICYFLYCMVRNFRTPSLECELCVKMRENYTFFSIFLQGKVWRFWNGFFGGTFCLGDLWGFYLEILEDINLKIDLLEILLWNSTSFSLPETPDLNNSKNLLILNQFNSRISSISEQLPPATSLTHLKSNHSVFLTCSISIPSYSILPFP